MELSDRTLLMLLDRQRGAGIMIDDQQYVRIEGETPLSFINRVRDAYSEWKASKEAEKAREERDRQDSRREATDRYNYPEFKPKSPVQKVEESLASTIEAKVNELASRCKRLRIESEEAIWRSNDLAARHQYALYELNRAEKWLKELQENDEQRSREISKEVGRDISGQVGQQKSPGSGGVVQENDTTFRNQESTETNTDYSGREV